MTNPPRTTFMGDFRKFFVRGLAVLLPSVLTIWLVVQAYKFVDERVAEPINAGVREVVIWSTPRLLSPRHQPEWFKIPEEVVVQEQNRRAAQGLPTRSNDDIRAELRGNALLEWWNRHIWLDFIGLIVAISLFYLAGRIFGGFLGRRIASAWESALARVPVFAQVFPYVKQVVEFVLGERQLEFKRVVMVEYPRQGVWSIGFITGAAMVQLERATREEMVTVFMPSSPTPFTGYTITTKKSDLLELDLTIEEAIRFVVSGGVLVPSRPRMDPDEVKAIIRGPHATAGGERGGEPANETAAESGDARGPVAEESDVGSTVVEDDQPAGKAKGDSAA